MVDWYLFNLSLLTSSIGSSERACTRKARAVYFPGKRAEEISVPWRRSAAIEVKAWTATGKKKHTSRETSILIVILFLLQRKEGSISQDWERKAAAEIASSQLHFVEQLADLKVSGSAFDQCLSVHRMTLRSSISIVVSCLFYSSFLFLSDEARRNRKAFSIGENRRDRPSHFREENMASAAFTSSSIQWMWELWRKNRCCLQSIMKTHLLVLTLLAWSLVMKLN